MVTGAPTSIRKVGEMKQRLFKRNLSFWVPMKENKVHVTEIKANTTTATFQQALRPIIIVGQLFSLLPVAGVASDDARDVKFVKTSWRCLYSFLSLIGQIFMSIFSIIRLANSNATLNDMSPVIFYGTTCITMVLFVRVARRWPQLVQYVANTEETDPHINATLIKKCNITCAIILILALFEHILALITSFASAGVCLPQKSTYEGFVMQFYPMVFNYLPYSPVLGGLTQFLNFQSTFVWNFSDLFIISISYYLTSRLDQVNEKILAAQGKYLPEIFWRASRESYCRMTQLVRNVDDVIGGIVFTSFANNLFFICLQLFNSLEYGLKGTGECNSKAKKTGLFGGNEAAIYFLFSVVYLLTRSVAVSLIASQVNIASTAPAPVLYDVPSPVYCVEVQRFLDQVNGEKVALSGLQFFSVTRGLLLTVAGTIVTYELVMFQFNPPSPSPQNNTPLAAVISNITS